MARDASFFKHTSSHHGGNQVFLSVVHATHNQTINIMSQENKNQQQNLNIDVTPEVAKGVYSNLAIISHSPSEIVLDFAQMLPGTPNANVRSRIIMSPIHAKRLLVALRDNIDKYEDQFGTIVDPAQSTVPFDMNTVGKA